MTDGELIHELYNEIDELNETIQDLKYENYEQAENSITIESLYNFIKQCEIRDELHGTHELTWSQAQKDFLEEYLQFFDN